MNFVSDTLDLINSRGSNLFRATAFRVVRYVVFAIGVIVLVVAGVVVSIFLVYVDTGVRVDLIFFDSNYDAFDAYFENLFKC